MSIDYFTQIWVSSLRIVVSMQDEIEALVMDAPKNEAYARCLFNNIIVSCIAEEKRKAIREYASGSSLTFSILNMTINPQTPKSKSTIQTETFAPLSLRFETPLSATVTYKKKEITISRIADFTLWFDDDDTMGTNLICVETKRIEHLSLAAGQCVGYMGINLRALNLYVVY